MYPRHQTSIFHIVILFPWIWRSYPDVPAAVDEHETIISLRREEKHIANTRFHQQLVHGFQVF